MALLALVIAESAPAYVVLMALSSSRLEAFWSFLDALGNLSGHLVGVEHHLFCHENPFV